jgi:hypothetical protein
MDTAADDQKLGLSTALGAVKCYFVRARGRRRVISMHTASKRWRVYALALLAGSVVAVAGVAAGCGGTKTVTKTVGTTVTKTATVTSTSKSQATPLLSVQLPPAAPAGQMVLYGHIKSLARKSGRFEMRFDPAWWLTGVAAEAAAVEDGATSPGQGVPNDYYIVDEGHRLLTYVVTPNAPVTIVTGGAGHARSTVSELAQRLSGKNPSGFGFWIRVGDKYPNPVLSLDQQFQP